jgi:hypothetical protein
LTSSLAMAVIRSFFGLCMDDFSDPSNFWTPYSAVVMLLASKLSTPNINWFAFIFHFCPANKTSYLWLLVSFALLCSGVPQDAIFITCLIVDAFVGRPAPIIPFLATTYLLDYVNQYWHLFPLAAKALLAVLCIIYVRTCFDADLGGVYPGLPEGVWGTWPAVFLHACELFLSPVYRWLAYVVLTEAIRAARPSLADVEWFVISFMLTSYGLGPGATFGANLLVNTFFHPLRRHLLHGARPTIPLLRQRKGTISFGLTYFGLWILRRSAAFWQYWAFAAILTTAVCAVIVLGVLVTQEINRIQVSSPPSTSTFYQYTALPDEYSFRILRIRPSITTSAPIHCDMLVASLVSPHPPYTGISYVWDPPNSSKETIFVNNRPFKVFPNVVAILQQMRSPVRTQCVWIDSICINQADKGEKEVQIKLMRRIYEGTAKVVGWLGGDCPEWPNLWRGIINSLREVLKTPRSKEYMAFIMVKRLNASRYTQDFDPDKSPRLYFEQHDMEYWEAFLALASNPFFTRVWIIQEITVPQFVFLRYGSWQFTWESYARAIAVVCQYGFRYLLLGATSVGGEDGAFSVAETPGIDNALIMENLRKWNGRGGLVPRRSSQLLSLKDTLKLCMLFRSTKEVDKIFALLGVAHDQDKLCIEPDCNDEHREAVFVETARTILQINKGKEGTLFDVLRFAGIGQLRNLVALPSWVPDWTSRIHTCVLTHWQPELNFRAGNEGPNAVAYAFLGNDAIALSGVIADTIKAVATFPRVPVNSRAGGDVFGAALRLFHGHEWYHPTNQSVTEAFWRTTIADSDTSHRPADRAAIDSWKVFWAECQAPMTDANKDAHEDIRTLRRGASTLDSEDKKLGHLVSSELTHSNPDRQEDFTSMLGPSYADRALAQFPLFMFGRKFCRTARGYMGLVPPGCLEGDKVVVFRGASTPHILRLAPGSHECGRGLRWQLVGEAYVHGMMDGEVIRARAHWNTIVLV